MFLELTASSLATTVLAALAKHQVGHRMMAFITKGPSVTLDLSREAAVTPLSETGVPVIYHSVVYDRSCYVPFYTDWTGPGESHRTVRYSTGPKPTPWSIALAPSDRHGLSLFGFADHLRIHPQDFYTADVVHALELADDAPGVVLRRADYRDRHVHRVPVQKGDGSFVTSDTFAYGVPLLGGAIAGGLCNAAAAIVGQMPFDTALLLGGAISGATTSLCLLPIRGHRERSMPVALGAAALINLAFHLGARFF